MCNVTIFESLLFVLVLAAIFSFYELVTSLSIRHFTVGENLVHIVMTLSFRAQEKRKALLIWLGKQNADIIYKRCGKHLEISVERANDFCTWF